MAKVEFGNGSMAYSGPLDAAGLRFIARGRLIHQQLARHMRDGTEVREPTEEEIEAALPDTAAMLPPNA